MAAIFARKHFDDRLGQLSSVNGFPHTMMTTDTDITLPIHDKSVGSFRIEPACPRVPCQGVGRKRFYGGFVMTDMQLSGLRHATMQFDQRYGVYDTPL